MSRIICTLLFLSVASFGQAQNSASAFFSSSEITWLGVDFSKVKLIGDFSQYQGYGETGPTEIRNQYFPGWNELIFNERSKFDIGGTFDKSSVIYEIDIINEVNAGANTEELMGRRAESMTKEMLASQVSGYKLGDLSGVGIVLVAEALNKPEAIGVYHLVALDLKSKDILFTRKIEGAPRGIGVRNYWAGSIYDAFKTIKKAYKKEWKSKKS